jgi:thymidylate synthase
MKDRFWDANEAFEYYLDKIRQFGWKTEVGTKKISNVGFYITNPAKNEIKTPERKWSKEYAEAEWQWYLSGDRQVSKLGEIYGKVPVIWQKMANSVGDVNSNYGWQWQREHQIDYVVSELKANPNSRRAAISIYDGKEWPNYRKDTPCTFAIHFSIASSHLNMTVMMRSNDLWFGFCNDQYCFSELQKLIAERLSIPIGEYYHFVCDLHLYEQHF